MGVAKAAFESTNRYLARDLGPQGHPLQPRRRRADPHHRGQVDPRLRAVRGELGRAGPRWAGTSTTPSPRPRPCVGPALRLVPRDDRRDRARRRRLPRDGAVSPPTGPDDPRVGTRPLSVGTGPAAAARGSRIVHRVPRPGLLCAVRLPRWASRTSLTRARPRPNRRRVVVPSGERADEVRQGCGVEALAVVHHVHPDLPL